MEFVDDLLIHSGAPENYYVDSAACRELLREGVLGIKVRIMLSWDPSAKTGPKRPWPDHVSIMDLKEETPPTTAISEQKGGKPEPLPSHSWNPRYNMVYPRVPLAAGSGVWICSVKTFKKILEEEKIKILKIKK